MVGLEKLENWKEVPMKSLVAQIVFREKTGVFLTVYTIKIKK